MIPKLTNIHLMMERADFQFIATELVKYYGLKSKVKMTASKGVEGDYDWDTDTIRLRRRYPSVKEFIISVLHEIHHALQRKKFGVNKYEKLYQRAGDVAVNKGKDFHDDNPFEEEAEKWAKKNLSKWAKKIK